jgi:hypothetical protein
MGFETQGVPGHPNWSECALDAIKKHKEAQGADRNAATKSSLLKLALTSIELHKTALVKGVKPWPDGKGPLAVALSALRTVAKNEQELNK